MQKFFLVLSFFLIHASLFSQSDDLEGKLKAQQELLEEKSRNSKKDTLTSNYYKINYIDGREEQVDTSLTIYKD